MSSGRRGQNVRKAVSSLPPDSGDSRVTPTATSSPVAVTAARTSRLASPLQAFLRGFINLGTMPVPLRTLTILGFALFGVVSAALALSGVAQPYVSTILEVDGQTTQIPLLALVVFTVVGGLGFAYALAGAMQLRLAPRMLIAALLTVLLGFQVLDALRSASTGGFIAVIDTATALGQAVVLALIWVWALGVSLLRSYHRRRLAVQSTQLDEAAPHYVADFLIALFLIGVYDGFDVLNWVLVRQQGAAFARVADTLFVDTLTRPIALFPIFSALVIYWFSTDSVDWATGLASGFVGAIQRVPWLLPVVMVAAGSVALVFVAMQAGTALIPEILTAATIAAIGFLVLVLGPSPQFWPRRVPVSALVAAVLTLFAVTEIPGDVLVILGALGQVRESLIAPLTGAFTVVIALVALVAGLALAAVGKARRRGDLAVSGLLMVLVTLLAVVASLNQIQARLGTALLPQPTYIPRGMEALVALVLLGELILLALRRQPLAAWHAALVGPFVALVGLFAVNWYGNYLLSQEDAAPSSVALLALIFLAQELWDVARSGEQITNGDSPTAPRPSRVQVYFGYVLVSAAFFLYGSTLRIQHTGAAVSGDLTGVSNDVAAIGILVLGFALVLVTGVTRVQQWRGEAAPADLPVSTRGAHRSLIAVLGVGSVLVAVFIAVIVAVIVPRAESGAGTTYFTRLPGPNCDTHGSDWTQGPEATLVCDQSDGLHVTVAGRGALGGVSFGFPRGVSSADYRVSVHATFGQTPSCVELITRSSEPGAYIARVCSDGSWAIDQADFAALTEKTLAEGRVSPAAGYTITAVARGNKQSIAIDGKTLATESDALAKDGGILLDVLNATSSPTTVVFSDFAYTPLS
jgi:hypothetical protein